MARDSAATRRFILAAADELFYAEGFHPVSVDAIAQKAGITKKTLYYHFRSKDELIAAYLEERDRPTLERFRKWAGEEGPVSERMDRMFDKLGQLIRSRTWRGCGFIRAAGELAHMPGHPAVQIARAHKARFESWLAGLLEAEGRAESAALARALIVLVDGTVTQLLLHRSPAYADAAKSAARALLQATGDRTPPEPAIMTLTST